MDRCPQRLACRAQIEWPELPLLDASFDSGTKVHEALLTHRSLVSEVWLLHVPGVPRPHEGDLIVVRMAEAKGHVGTVGAGE